VTDHVTLRLHIGELYLINYVTSEGIWLHHIIFRGFIAKGVKTDACTTFPFFFIVLEFFETSFFFFFHFTNLNYFVYVHYMKSKLKNIFKLQVLMQQKHQGGEYFCKAL
jgi:hypothetical protein